MRALKKNSNKPTIQQVGGFNKSKAIRLFIYYWSLQKVALLCFAYTYSCLHNTHGSALS